VAHSLAFLDNLLGMDGLVVLVMGLLLFGRHLPGMVRNVGRDFSEFDEDERRLFLFGLLVIFTIALTSCLLAWYNRIPL
jgi:hypothetical protein